MLQRKYILIVMILSLSSVQSVHPWSWPSFKITSVVRLFSTMCSSFSNRFLWIRKSQLNEAESKLKNEFGAAISKMHDSVQIEIQQLNNERTQAINALALEIGSTGQRVVHIAGLVQAVQDVAGQLENKAQGLNEQTTQLDGLFAQVQQRDLQLNEQYQNLQSSLDGVITVQNEQKIRSGNVLVGLRALVERLKKLEQQPCDDRHALPKTSGVAAMAHRASTGSQFLNHRLAQIDNGQGDSNG